MSRFIRENSLSLAFGVLFLFALVFQSFAGHAEFNQQQVADKAPEVAYLRYATSSSFMVDTLENWQSEFLQFFLYVWLTVWLVQKGSSESKKLDEIGRESDAQQRVGEHTQPDSPSLAKRSGFWHKAYAHSLLIVFGLIFVLTWVASSVTGWTRLNEENLRQLQPPESYGQYVMSPDFWNRTLQNWQSEFLAVGTMAVFSIWLRERGSPESKPVGAPHAETGATS